MKNPLSFRWISEPDICYNTSVMDFGDTIILAASCGCGESDKRESDTPCAPKVERGLGFLVAIAALVAATLYAVCRITWWLLS